MCRSNCLLRLVYFCAWDAKPAATKGTVSSERYSTVIGSICLWARWNTPCVICFYNPYIRDFCHNLISTVCCLLYCFSLRCVDKVLGRVGRWMCWTAVPTMLGSNTDQTEIDFALGGPGPNQIGSPSALESPGFDSRFLLSYPHAPLLFCLPSLFPLSSCLAAH